MTHPFNVELQGADLEYQKYKHLIGELASYFKCWRSDAGLDSMDLDDWCIEFDDEYDLSDE